MCMCCCYHSYWGLFALLGPLRTLFEVFKNLAWGFKNLV